jgi:hypothetical protein
MGSKALAVTRADMAEDTVGSRGLPEPALEGQKAPW